MARRLPVDTLGEPNIACYKIDDTCPRIRHGIMVQPLSRGITRSRYTIVA